VFVEIVDRDKTKIIAATPFLRLPIITKVSASLDLLPFTGPVESSASGILKLDGNGGSRYLIGR
jgi:hypothetical protein